MASPVGSFTRTERSALVLPGSFSCQSGSPGCSATTENVTSDVLTFPAASSAVKTTSCSPGASKAEDVSYGREIGLPSNSAETSFTSLASSTSASIVNSPLYSLPSSTEGVMTGAVLSVMTVVVTSSSSKTALISCSPSSTVVVSNRKDSDANVSCSSVKVKSYTDCFPALSPTA